MGGAANWLCLVSDAWDVTHLQTPGRDPHLEILLHNRGFERLWDTDCSRFHVCINSVVVIKTINTIQRGRTLYIACAVAAW